MIRLAESVHQQGYKVVLTGEGADEALAGYGWFKLQKLQQATGWLCHACVTPWDGRASGRRQQVSSAPLRSAPCTAFAPCSRASLNTLVAAGKRFTPRKCGRRWRTIHPLTIWI